MWLLATGKKSKEVAAITGYSLHWIYELVRGYNRLGPESLGDKRQENHGRTPLLNDEQQAQLWSVLQSAPPDGGLWNGSKVAQWMSELLDRPVAPQRGWDYLRSLEYVRRRPRPAHIDSDPEEQQQWKKKLRRELLRLKRNTVMHP
ncbi:winged helix-turn-helix domain-containing protein [Roseofilum sp. Guam]|uniref:winged helix-turn-helix domain-containing protein n=1 Tax=Roseofilum sp. Guam TaxID=2821502 RepID=UPI001B15F3F4|nr:winged helix-turn-helix domain-containing protein [Roseofilum sp. Guam]MBP0030222.1 winged helix-turn-helix domain-containing protein [Roseofilum sp. Guam]